METVFLWLVLCIDGKPCQNAQVYQMDSFVGAAARSDCEENRKSISTRLTKAAPPGSRLGCKTLIEFNRDGVES